MIEARRRGHSVETGLDYFGARYYRADLGRFTTVDPVQTWTENLVDPQRWGRYGYVRNNPLQYVDPDGREIKVPAALKPLYERARQSAKVREYLKPFEGKKGRALIFQVASIPKAGTTSIDFKEKGLDPNTLQETYDINGPVTISINAALAAPGVPDDLADDYGPTATMCEEIGHAGAAAKDPNSYARQESIDKSAKTHYEDKNSEQNAKRFSKEARDEIKKVEQQKRPQ